MTHVNGHERVAIIGAGVGGTLLANLLKSYNITVFEKAKMHVYQPSWLYTAIYGKPEISRPEIDLIPKNVKYVPEEVIKIDLSNRFVLTKTRKFEYDRVVIATGTNSAPEKIPGLATLIDQYGNFHTNETLALKTWQSLQKFKGGNLVIGLAYPIYKFPPTALEAAFLIDERLRKFNLRNKTEITFFSPFMGAYPSKPMDEVIQPILKAKDIKVLAPFDLDEVDTKQHILRSLEGDELTYDLAIIVPPQTGTFIITDPVVNEDGFISTDKEKLNIKGFDDAFAIGDVASIPSAKSGATTYIQARVLANRLTGGIAKYDGRTNCPFEVGGHKLTFVIGNYSTSTVKLLPTRRYYYMKKLFNTLYWGTIRGKYQWLFDWYFEHMSPQKLKTHGF